jgi:hypothetical protein
MRNTLVQELCGKVALKQALSRPPLIYWHVTAIPARDLAALEDEITELAAHINTATYRLLTLIHEFDERHGWSYAGLKSCAH